MERHRSGGFPSRFRLDEQALPARASQGITAQRARISLESGPGESGATVFEKSSQESPPDLSPKSVLTLVEAAERAS